MNKLVIWTVIGLVALGILFGGYYFVQFDKKQASNGDNISVTDSSKEFPSELNIKLFDALQKSLG